MEVSFTRTGERRYAVSISSAGGANLYANPAPGYDDHIPHDLVHYLVEAVLKLDGGVFGRAARGGSGFLGAQDGMSARERSRQRRRRQKREARLDATDAKGDGDMVRAERLALLCDVTFRRRHAARAASLPGVRLEPPTPAEVADVERVMPMLEEASTVWTQLAHGAALVFQWPEVRPTVRS